MAYLNLDPNYFEHPKTKRLVGLLGSGAESLPIKLWCYCAKYHPEQALLQAYLIEEIEAIVGWTGERGKMVEAMVRVGFLKKIRGGYVINDWLDHEGHIAKFKQRSKLAAKARWDKISKTKEKTSNAISNAKDEFKHHPLPYLTLPNKDTPQEIYEYYSKTIKPGAKEDAIRNIIKLLKTLTKEDLIGRINAYKQDLTKKGTEERYYIQANNFFGRAARYKDFEAAKPKPVPKPDPKCDICKGKGIIPEGSLKGAVCNCVK